MADWVDIDKLLKAYQGDLTKKATGWQNFAQSISQAPAPISNSAPSNLATPINWNQNTDQANESVPNRGGPSVVSRIFDVLSRPGYAVSEGARQAFIDDPNDQNRVDNVLGGIVQGFTGKKKTRFNRVMDEIEYNEDKDRPNGISPEDWEKVKSTYWNENSRFSDILNNPSYNPNDYKIPDKGEGSPINAILGLTTDVATDPLNLIGGPLIRAGIKGTKAGYNAVKGIEELDIPAQVSYVNPTRNPINRPGVGNAGLGPVPDANFPTAIEEPNKFLSYFRTQEGNKYLRPEVLSVQQSARARAVSRATVLNNIAKKFDPTQISQAFKIAQNRTTMTGMADVDKLGRDFEKSVRDLFNGSDLRPYATLANSNVKGSKQGLIEDINEQLRIHGEKFQFATEVDDAFRNGQKVDLSGANRWMDAWKYHKFDDPLAFMSKLSHAVENVTAKYNFLDDFATRFGSKTFQPGRTKLPSGKFTPANNTGIRNQRLQGLYFDKDIAKEMGYVLRNWDLVSSPRSPFIKLVDNVTSLWKTGVTIYAPSHHIRNLIGDTYFNWMDGVNTVKPYTTAAKVLAAKHGRYKDVADLDNLTSKAALSNALRNPGNRALTTRGGIPFTYDAVYTAAYDQGLLQSANTIEDIGDKVIDLKNIKNPVLNKIFNPTGGRYSNMVRQGTEVREHYVKLAHFIDLLKKSKTTNVDEAVAQAAQRVRKWHPDGMDLTPFERNVAKRVMPFYSWTRKSIPLIVEGTIRNPGKALFYPRFQQMLQDANGVQSASLTDPFPEDQLFPDWIKEKGIGPISFHGNDGPIGFLDNFARSGTSLSGEKAGYNVVNPSNPLIDTIAQYAGMGRPKDTISGIAGGINPLARIPAEIMTGRTTQGTPINYDPAKYTTEQIPILAYLSQLGNVTPFGATSRGTKEGLFNEEGIINFLTALGLRGTGASIKTAEFEAKERAKHG